MALPVKICGFTRGEDLHAAMELGASFLGFVFYPPSPRSLEPARWRALAGGRDAAMPDAGMPGAGMPGAGMPDAGTPGAGVPCVGVMVDPDDDWIDAVMSAAPLDMLQLHGKESPERVAEIARRTGCRIIKTIAVSGEGDVERHRAYTDIAEMILFDAKPPAEPGAIPGGNGLAFDWRLLAGKAISRPWLLAGGITADNIEQAVRLTGAPAVDASSSLEVAPGIKDRQKMRRLLERAKAIETAGTKISKGTLHGS